MKILIVSDAWQPQINGVVRTLQATVQELERLGHDVLICRPEEARAFVVSIKAYPDIRLEFFAHARLWKKITDYEPAAIHIATEGPLGWAARRVCLRHGLPFTTSYHTRFADYFAARAAKPFKRLVHFVFAWGLRRFHKPSAAIMVATPSLEEDLRAQGFSRLRLWSRGVDVTLFQVSRKPFPFYENLAPPLLLYVGRVAVEKNLPAFLGLRTSGSHIVIGDGPDLEALRAANPHAHFLGALTGKSLAEHFAAADLFVFPSKTETFGLVLLEACASGLRIAAYPAPGPRDIFGTNGPTPFAILDPDLQKAVDRALLLSDDPELPRRFATGFSWVACTVQFLANLRQAREIVWAERDC